MRFDLKTLLARGPETIKPEGVFVRDPPLEELGLTVLYILFAGIWFVFADDVFSWASGVPLKSPALQTMTGINFVVTTGLVLYLVLRRTFRTRRLAQEASRLSQERFEYVALATTDAIWDLNLDTKVVWWSEGVQKLFGYPAGDVSSKYEWWLDRVHPEDRDKVVGGIWRTVEHGGTAWAREYRFRRKDDTYATVMDRGYIIYDAAGKPVRLVGGLSDISERRAAERALENSRQQLRALTARLQSGREAERAAVAREIHDDLGQMLTALKLNLDWVEREIGEREADTTLNPMLERVLESGEIIEGAIQSVQRIAADLRPAALDDLGLAEALREEARRFKERSSIACEVRLPSKSLALPSETSTAIFRVFQEALTNVARHAKATSVNMSLETRADSIVLQLEDNGKGIPPEAIGDPRSLGLLGMAERASSLGGHVAVAPVAPHGTRVTLQLPWKSGAAASGAAL
jgi:two-component system sensor histidine kinase UhpB